MIKKILKKMSVMTVVGIMALSVGTGCSTDAYTSYKAATEKTESAESGVYSLHFNLENTFDTTDATEEELKLINYLKSIAVQTTTTIDSKKESLISEVFASVGGIGFDFTFYKQKDAMYLKYPVMKKYIDLKAMQTQFGEGSATPMNFSISPETQEALKALWGNLATKENVKRGEKTGVSLRGGTVKATQYIITIEGETLKKTMIESVKLLAKDPQLTEQLSKTMALESKGQSRTKETINIKDINSVVKAFETLEIDEVTMEALVDSDGYVVREKIDVAYHNTNSAIQPSQTRFSLKMTNTELNQPVEIVMPKWTPENVYTKEELNKDIPALFRDLTK